MSSALGFGLIALLLLPQAAEGVRGPGGPIIEVVVADPDAQVILARGAAFSNRLYVDDAAQGRARFPSRAFILTGAAAVAIAALLTLASAGGPIRLVDSDFRQSGNPLAQPIAIPAGAAPVAPQILPAVAAQPVPDEPSAVPILEPPPAAFNAVLPEVIGPPVLEAVPDPPPVQHLPEAQPVGVPGPASVPPPPSPDPIGQILFGALP